MARRRRNADTNPYTQQMWDGTWGIYFDVWSQRRGYMLRLHWIDPDVGSGFKVEEVGRTEKFPTRADAEMAIVDRAIPHIKRWSDDEVQYIRGWERNPGKRRAKRRRNVSTHPVDMAAAELLRADIPIEAATGIIEPHPEAKPPYYAIYGYGGAPMHVGSPSDAAYLLARRVGGLAAADAITRAGKKSGVEPMRVAANARLRWRRGAVDRSWEAPYGGGLFVIEPGFKLNSPQSHLLVLLWWGPDGQQWADPGVFETAREAKAAATDVLRAGTGPLDANHRNGGGRWASSTEIQSLLFDKRQWTPARIRAWARSHGYTAGKIDAGGESARFYRVRQHAPSSYMGGRVRTITLSDAKGIKAVVGVPTRASGRQRRRRSA